MSRTRSSKKAILSLLRSRGLVNNTTSEHIGKVLSEKSNASAYCGFDPTARSLHIGNLLPAITLRHMQTSGIRPILLVGGATGMIGDPSGKSEDRNLLSSEIIEENVKGIQKDLQNILDFDCPQYGVKIVNNMDWHGKMTSIEWLRDIGSFFRLSSMLGRESVKSRLDSETGMSFLEFSYQIFQAYDFLHLYQNETCLVQLGGSDQWGNIISGCELVRKKTGNEVFGITLPLLTTGSGEKFGKSAGNALFLNPTMTSEYDFYQYFIRTEDSHVEKLLKLFTMLTLQDITDIVQEHQHQPDRRLAQTILADEITKWVHGKSGVEKAKSSASLLFGGNLQQISANALLSVAPNAPSVQLSKNKVYGMNVVELAVTSGLCKSKAECRRLIQGGGLYLNTQKVTDDTFKISSKDTVEDQVLLLRSGKDVWFCSFH